MNITILHDEYSDKVHCTDGDGVKWIDSKDAQK